MIRRGHQAPAVWCGECGPAARMLKPEDAALATGIGTRQIYARIESGSVHFAEMAGGWLMVCQRSLSGTERAAKPKDDPALLISDLLKAS